MSLNPDSPHTTLGDFRSASARHPAGNNRQATFAAEADCQCVRDVLVEAAAEHGLAIDAYLR